MIVKTSYGENILIGKRPVFYREFFEANIIQVNDLLFELNNVDSFNIISKKINKTNFLVWIGLRYSIPPDLKHNNTSSLPFCFASSPSLKIDEKVFDVLEKKSKDFYVLFISTKVQCPNNSENQKREFKLTYVQLEHVFSLHHVASIESYVKAFQYKVLNNILCTNTKLCKIGYTTDARYDSPSVKLNPKL